MYTTGISARCSAMNVNNAFIRESTTYYTLDSEEGSPYTLSSDERTLEDHASIEILQRDRESLEEPFDSNMAGQPHTAPAQEN
jgi:hypothetical protein